LPQHDNLIDVPVKKCIAWLAIGSGLTLTASATPARPDSSRTENYPAPTYLAPQSPTKPTFWVVNFGTARTLPKGRIGFAAGIGGQVVLIGDPQKASAFFSIPHAGFRFGLARRLDAGLRLAPIPLPYATVGPGFGVNLDVKYLLTKPDSKVDFSLVLGAGGAHVLIDEKARYAYSPNVALLNSYHLAGTTVLTLMGRYVYLGIPSAPEGAKANFVNITGLSVGLKKDLKPNIALLPEIGAYWYEGKIAGVRKAGPGFQYGIMLATSF
jgi:hypothetical protein